MEYPLSYKRFLEQDRKLFTDSRKVIPGGIFVALKGDNFNGNQYAMEAIEKGAAYAIVDVPLANTDQLIVVEDCLKELQSMAALHRKINKAKIIAITGTNGKTTTKELTLSIFKIAFNSIATLGNFNNHIGVPLSLLRIDENTDYAIIEMGANQPGDIAELCKIADPDIGLITNIGKAHLEGFKNVEGIINTKMELFDYLKKHEGICVYNMFSKPIKEKYSAMKNSVCFGDKDLAYDYYGTLMQSFPEIKMVFGNSNQEIELNSVLFGEYNYQNILSACTLASICDIPFHQIKEGVSNYIPGNMRSEIIHKNGNTILLDAYNANPSSMKEVVDIFDKMNFKTKWILLGEMAELGAYKESEHDALINLVAEKHFDKKIFIGKIYNHFKTMAGIMVFDDLATCKDWLQINWPENAAILIKGSRSSGMERLIH